VDNVVDLSIQLFANTIWAIINGKIKDFLYIQNVFKYTPDGDKELKTVKLKKCLKHFFIMMNKCLDLSDHPKGRSNLYSFVSFAHTSCQYVRCVLTIAPKNPIYQNTPTYCVFARTYV